MNPSSPFEKIWKVDLLQLQLAAPKPKPVLCSSSISERPNFYGLEYHGEINHKKTEEIFELRDDGEFLVRKSPGSKDFYTLSLRFDGKTKHYKIYYNPNYGHFLKEDFKRFETIEDLVADGLVNFYLQKHAAPIIQQMLVQTKNSFQQSPYMTLNRRKLRAISNELRRSLKVQEIIDNNCNTNNSSSNLSDENQPLLMPDVVETSTSAMNNNNFNFMSQIEEQENEPLPMIYEKMHRFVINNFKGINFCEFCGNFLWGFTAQGVRCDDCGFVAHKKCSELVPAKCVPDLKKIRGIFGIDLTTIVQAHKSHIPFVITKCVQEVEKRGLQQEGIYRISGFADEIETLKLALDKEGEKTDMSESSYNINVITGTLKLYLRLLPIPLITFQAYPVFITATKEKSETEIVQKLRDAIKTLPTAHLNCLKYIITHLNKVASHQAVNKMTEHNLATVFAPTLIATPPHQLTDMSQEIFILTNMIKHCQTIFMQGK
ncbi:beta-chimaerin [Chironomus tepperi]|uniref:beta-chimaerin n=1 Tax=Chironomus tepperi TaxID=113505 RepID=UPI00391F18C0